MSEKLFWNEAAELLSGEKLQQLHWKKLKKQLAYCYENSPEFYRKKFESAGVRPNDIRSLEDFRRLPIFVTKEEDLRSQEDSLERYGHPFGLFLCAPLDEVIAVHATAGTTGRPTFYAFTRHDLQVTAEVMARGYWRAGVRPGETVLHAMGLSMWIGGIPVVQALQHMGARPIPVGAEGGSERLLQMARLTRPTTLICTPSYAEYLIEKAPKAIGAPVGDLGLERIVCFGEPGAGLPEVRRKIEEAYGAQLYDSGQGPWGLYAISCEASVGSSTYFGMHVVSQDYVIMYDLVDPQTKEPLPIVDGTIGEFVFTTLEWEASPALRYSLGDINQIFLEDCPCGVKGLRRRILGRVDDMLIVKGINVYPAAVKNVVNSFVPRVTGEMRIVLLEPPPRVTPPLRLKVEYGQNLSRTDQEILKQEMERKLSDLLRFHPEVELVSPGSLPRAADLGLRKAPLLEKLYENCS
ncbi:MAG: phenylacetate--CoA ligase family protein [Candidatus Tectomicrobia bacterium]|uniref:Phenylacetate--CoA ligase family protein n=1 Tax=Tectimicrobiota bacterium TaxID=2528274 RepID=A0A932GQG3_UNCTE|nr:phenylacetate--CoA ligase family protein [Candidatus Tectomicrobia bacterium]